MTVHKYCGGAGKCVSRGITHIFDPHPQKCFRPGLADQHTQHTDRGGNKINTIHFSRYKLKTFDIFQVYVYEPYRKCCIQMDQRAQYLERNNSEMRRFSLLLLSHVYNVRCYIVSMIIFFTLRLCITMFCIVNMMIFLTLRYLYYNVKWVYYTTLKCHLKYDH